jgi:hypothetical protein
MLNLFVTFTLYKPGVLMQITSALVLACSPALLIGQSAQVHFRMVDGRNGHPWAKKHMEVYDARSDPRYPPKTLFEGKTDEHGGLIVDLDRSTVIGVTGSSQSQRCLTRGRSVAPQWRVADIVASGAVQENTCNFKIVVTPTPGELVVFIRPETLKEILD